MDWVTGGPLGGHSLHLNCVASSGDVRGDSTRHELQHMWPQLIVATVPEWVPARSPHWLQMSGTGS